MTTSNAAWWRSGAAMLILLIGSAHHAAVGQTKGDPTSGAAKAEACASCHGTPARAPAPGMPTLAGQPEQFFVLQMILLREGLRDVPQMMPFIKGLSDRDISDIAAYFARERPPPGAGGERTETLYARGAALARTMNCGSCHLADYSGQKQMPRLAGQREDYLAAAMKAYRDDKRTGSDTSMNGVLYGVSDADIGALAHFLTRQ